MNTTFTEVRAAEVPVRRTSALVGRARATHYRATHYRHARGRLHGPRQARAVPDNGQALTEAERAAVLSLINTEAYADLSIGQIWARELGTGNYLCSASSTYRIARAAEQPGSFLGRGFPTGVNVSELRGHPVVINLWATWCGPCPAGPAEEARRCRSSRMRTPATATGCSYWARTPRTTLPAPEPSCRRQA